MVKLAIENGKFIIKDGKVAIVQDGQSGCGCCCKECCWKVQALTGCPGPEVDADLEGNSFSFRFMDSESCRDIGDPQNCKPNPNKETDTTDKTTCDQLQYIILTNEWTISETTNVTVDLSGSAETGAPDKDYIDITITPLSGQKIIGDGGDPRFRTANTYHARIASDDGDLGSSEDGCNMNDISGSWNFELQPGCWGVKVYSCTRDAFSHIGMENSVKFSFDTEAPKNCKDHLCTNVTCGGIINGGGGAGTGGTGAIREEKNPRDGKDYGFALIDQPITECTLEDWDEEGEPPSSISDCVKACENDPDNPCKRIEYYCCVDGVCNRFSRKLCGNELTKSSDEKSGVDGEADVLGAGADFCSEEGPYFCTLQQCTDSAECKVKYCCDAEDETCRPCNKVTKSSDEKNGVDGNGFDTIEDCRQICEAGAKYNCDTGIGGESAQCVKAKDPNNAQYENIDDCLTDCEEGKGNRYTCTEAGECLKNAFGEYDNEQICIDDCGGGGGRWYCCYDGPPPVPPAKDTRKTVCTPEQIPPQLDEDGNVVPVCEHGAASGPHSAKACSIACGGHDCVRRCDGSKICIKKENGKYVSLGECLADCRTMRGPKPPCELSEGAGGILDVDNEDPDDPELDIEWKYFTIDEFERNICVTYSTSGKPVKIQFYRGVCDANGNITKVRLAISSPWFGEEECDCEARKRAGGTIENKLDGEVRWKKPRGLGLFAVKILSCDSGAYKYEVECDNCKKIDPKKEPENGACCNPRGENNEDWPDQWGELCEEDVSKKTCEGVGGEFLGPCSECKDEDGNDNCNIKKGACCINKEDVRECRRKTKKGCEKIGGDYRGDDTWCDNAENRANEDIPKDKLILCPGLGACCILEWVEIPITDCSVVDYIEGDGKKLSDSDTVTCESEGECKSIEVNVVNKNIKCIENNEENRNKLAGKIDVVQALTGITLPENNCDESTVPKEEHKTDILALEKYPDSYQPLFTIKTKSPNLNVKFQKIGAKNGGKVGDVVVQKDGETIVGVYYASKYICEQIDQDDCDGKEGSFTENQNCCKTFAENGVDCDEEWCDEEVAAKGFRSYGYSTSDSIVDNYTKEIEKPVSSGPGTELKKLLSKIGINASPSCSCNSRARVMDQWGPEKCEQEIDTILGWLKEEASKRKLPFVDMAGYILIKRAIYNARKNNK